MIDWFVILTPILLLAIIALFGFVGCDRVLGLNPVSPPVQHVQTTVKTGASGTNTLTADPLTLMGGELIIVTVQWKSAAAPPSTPSLSGANFTAITVGGQGTEQYFWNGLAIQSFWATNPQGNTSLTVQVVLMDGSNPSNSASTWNLCVSAYSNVDSGVAPYSPQASATNYIGTTPTTAAAINLGDGDIIYAVGFAADANGTFPGNNPLTAGSDLTAEFPSVTNPLVEDGGSGTISAQVTNTSNNPSPKGFILAMGITAKPAS
jgi:hypothetical protein